MLDENISFGQRVAALRHKKGFSQATLAQIAGVGKSTISNYETGYCPSNSAIAIKLAEALDTTPEYLLSGTEIQSLSDPLLNYSHASKIPIYNTKSYKDIMSVDNEKAKGFMEIPNFFSARFKRCLALYAPDSLMDGSKIQKGDLVVVQWTSISLCDNREVMKERIAEEFENGKIYAFESGGKFLIRRLFDRMGKFAAVTDSKLYQNRPQAYEYDEIHLIGKCVGAVILM